MNTKITTYELMNIVDLLQYSFKEVIIKWSDNYTHYTLFVHYKSDKLSIVVPRYYSNNEDYIIITNKISIVIKQFIDNIKN